MSVFTNPASSSREQGQAYTAAILGLLGDQDPMAVLEGTAAKVKALLKGLSKEQLMKPEAPGKWSVAAVVRHLADSEIVWGWRMRMVLAHDRPEITGYDQDAWADRLRYMEADAKEALAEFEVLRAGNLRLLRRCGPDDLKRHGVHAERGQESVAHMMKMYAGHDMLHLRQIGRIVGA
ncbi:MAG: DinB family protein [Gemmatimonadaceae bacterium]